MIQDLVHFFTILQARIEVETPMLTRVNICARFELAIAHTCVRLMGVTFFCP